MKDVREVVDSLRRIIRALRLSDLEAERKLGISVAQLFVLQRLADGEPRSMSEVAKGTMTDLSSVSAVVAHLVDRGLVQRRTDTKDRRRAALKITSEGQALLKRAPEAPQTRLFAAVAELPERRRRELAGSLDLIAKALGAGEASLFFEDE